MESIDQSGRTVEEAVNTALEALGVSRDQVNVEILAHESRGLLGILGSPARVRVTLKSAAPPSPAPGPPSPGRPDQPLPPRAAPEPPPAPPRLAPEAVSDLGRAATDLVTRVLQLMEVDAQPEVIADDDGVTINLRTETETGLLIGRHGQTLAALQLLVAMITNRALPPEERRRIILDVEGYRERREIALRSMARASAERATRTGRPVRLEALNPRERRIVHLALSDNPDVSTRSEGEEPNRVIIITPNRSRPSP